MLRKVGVTGALAAVVAVAVSATLGGTASARISAGALATANHSCNTPFTIGVAYPETGPAASLGALQWDWAQFAASRWNNGHKPKINLLQGDTQLAGANPQALQVAQAFASNQAVMAVTGPAGSQENIQSIAAYQAGGLAAVSGSATRVSLTRGPGRQTPVGYFFRTVPNDGQQGQNVADYIANVLHATHVRIIDDQEAYSTGLRDQVKSNLQAKGVAVTLDSISQQTPDYSSVITAIPSNTDVVYIPWQVASMAQTFYTGLHAAGKGSMIVFGSDGTDDPSSFYGAGSYVSGFPHAPDNPIFQAFKTSHGGQGEAFGLPTYTSVLANAKAIKLACAGQISTTRAGIRGQLKNVFIGTFSSLLGFPVHFLTFNKGKFQGPGDMGGTAAFGIYKIQNDGSYKRVG